MSKAEGQDTGGEEKELPGDEDISGSGWKGALGEPGGRPHYWGGNRLLKREREIVLERSSVSSHFVKPKVFDFSVDS